VITYLDLTFSTDKPNPIGTVKRLEQMHGISLIRGEHDLMFHWSTRDEFENRIQAIHSVLSGTGAIYRVHTEENPPSDGIPVVWLPPRES
jgi:hypothetical protein